MKSLVHFRKGGNAQSGQAMITSVVFFLVIGLIIVVGASETVIRDLRSAENIVKSRESYALSEALHEDVVYRLKKNMTVGASETLSLNGFTATSTVSSANGITQVNTQGDRAGYTKKIQTNLSNGSGGNFNYGVQVGSGGLTLNNTSYILGNVYSNGPVTGTANVSTGNVTNPPIVGSVSVSLSASAGATDIALSTNYAYAYVLSSNYFEIINVINPASPVYVKKVATQYVSNPYYTNLYVSGNYLYITGLNANYLDIYDITDPVNPVYVTHVATGTTPKAFTVAGGYAYVPNYNSNTMSVVNVSVPSAAAVVSTVSTRAYPRSTLVSGSYLYVVCDDVTGNYGSVQVFSLTNPAAPALVGTTPTTTFFGHAAEGYIAGNYLYDISYSGGLLNVTKILNPAAPVVVYNTAYNTANDPGQVTGAAGYLYLALNDSHVSNGTLDIWSIASSTLPVKVNSISITASAGKPVAVQVANGYLYVLNTASSASSKLQIYNLAGGSGGNLVQGDVVSAGSTGTITNIHATSSMYARSITNSVVDNNAYYQTMSASSVGGQSFPGSADQATTSFAISDTTIGDWETSATSGGIYTGPCPYNLSGSSPVTLGPIQINCDLNISNSAVVNLAGMVWVKGDVVISNSSVIQVSPLISGKTVAIIADNPANRLSSSDISISNSATFNGNGVNSYVMFVSQNNSAELGGGASAITVSNSVSGKLLIYAPHGLINISNSVNLKEVTAYKLQLNNSASVLYETGLANLLFTAGPSSGYQIDTWQEVQ